MTAIEQEAERLANRAVTALAATIPEPNKIALGNEIAAFLRSYGSSLEVWRREELEWAVAELNPATRVGSVEKPNMYTTSAASQKDDSFSAEFFSLKTVREIGENAKGALGEVASGMTKGLAASALKIGAAVVVIAGAFMVAKKKGWI